MIEELNGKSMNIVEDNISKLKAIFPEVFNEDKIDFDKLQVLLGENIDTDVIEKYQMNWEGKMESIKLAQQQSTGTLRPSKEDSKDWDNTHNIYIEGDNLEVLKLLQASYQNSIKMIYIDPPYNTGSDFIYKDDFSDNIENYKKITGQATKSNPETAGRYHTKWLNMIYPRLKLAKSLLKDDGVIFISIDDNEYANLKRIAGEIFGEDNFVASIIWERAYSPVNLKKHFSECHDYILCYAKNLNLLECNGLKRTDDANDRYSNPDNDERGVWKSSDFSVGPRVEKNVYEIVTPSGRVVLPPSGRCWRVTKERYQELLADNRVWFGEDGNNVPSTKRFLSEVKQGMTPMTIWKYTEVGHSQDAMKNLKDLFDGKAYFDYPKSVELIKRMIQLYTNKNDLVLDFFSGSGTTAQAIMEFNAEDNGARKYILVQLPELTKQNSEAYCDGYMTICQIGEERIRRAGDKVKNDLFNLKKLGKIDENKTRIGIAEQVVPYDEKAPFTTLEYDKETEQTEINKYDEKSNSYAFNPDLLDIGFRVFKLDSSNIKKWDTTPTDDLNQIEMRIIDQMDYLKADRTDLDLVYEIMLKSGLSLDLQVEEHNIDGVKLYVVNNPEFKVGICLDKKLTVEIVEKMLSDIDVIGTFIFAETCFADANQKINTAEILKRENRKMRIF